MKFKVLSHEYFWDTERGNGNIRINTRNIHKPYNEMSFSLRLRRAREITFYMDILSNDKYKGQLLYNDENNLLSSAPVEND